MILLQSTIKSDDLLLFIAMGTLIFFLLLGITVAFAVGVNKRNRLLTAQILLLAEIALKDGVNKEIVIGILHKTKDFELLKIK